MSASTTPETILITGGAGFIGSAVIRNLLSETDVRIVNVDCLTYAANRTALAEFERYGKDRYAFVEASITDKATMAKVLEDQRPDAIMHLAAESHVDRSIDGPAAFIETNIIGTFVLLELATSLYQGMDQQKKKRFRFHHVSTDEVFGSLGKEGLFTEDTPYDPRSPYSASKASSDHLVRAWHHTYGLPVILTNCSNNYGPWQFPEKLIPVMISKGLAGEPLPVYGDGQQVRDWLHVDDHARALWKVLTEGPVGETFCIGGHNEIANIDIVNLICDLLDELSPGNKPRRSQITFVADRPGHDRRYAIDASRIEKDLGWRPQETFETGIRKTVQWYLENQVWWKEIQSSAYAGERLGLKTK